MKYIINHKIKGYTGKSACLVFSNGVSETNDSWVASWFKSKGHDVIEYSLNDDETVDVDEITEGDIKENLDYSSYSLEDLKTIAKEKGVEGLSKLNKADLIQALKTLEELENE